MKIGSDWESTLLRVAQLVGVAAAVSAAPSRDAKMLVLAQSLGGLAGATHAEQVADAEARASVTRQAAQAPGRSRPRHRSGRPNARVVARRK